MLSNANFVGGSYNNITIIPDEYGYTDLQCINREGGEYHGTALHGATVRFSADYLLNLIDALVMRYNDLPEYNRDNIKLEIKRIIQEAPKSVDDVPF